MSSSRSAACLVAALVVALLTAAPAGAEPTLTVDRIMIWDVPAAVTLAGATELRVEVLRDGGAVYAERFTVVAPPQTRGGAVEILAAEPERRSLLATLSDRGNVKLEARITRDGEELDRLPLAALLTRGAAMAERPAELLPLRFDRAAPAPTDEPSLFVATAAESDCTERSVCRQECWNDYYACVERFCPSYSGSKLLPPECRFCEDDRVQCERACPYCCTEPKSTTYSTSRELISATWTDMGCYSALNGKYVFDHYWAEYKYTRYKHTEACDGTVTTTIDSVWYEQGYCSEWTSRTCSWLSAGSPHPSC